ncbi:MULTISPECIES: XRE family transcriptional regulator [Metabacillus]|jgi:XRE family transcriptional regulator, regulator of sulfur utilization|uniref:XRE family transcriptional regulator n=2 Tax=Metabacillus TaxID=2675233 RepID=A0A179SLL8_9BACI|nr:MULTISPECIES: XRE family transcriptional regulator [Metabacillus]OAS82526.1 XRE family transcriptional regulator [Metabacillus litoralis]QNF26711.1 helix-turn-helix domain-containing protein [Metabacillus sp. KUDC1714]
MDKNFLSNQIGQRLRFYRQQRQLSLDDLAELTGVSKPMLGQIERGSSNPTVAILWKIASGLQIPFASFLIRDPSIKIIKKDEQPFFKEDNDLFETYNTFASPGIPLEIFRIRLLPGCMHHSAPSGIGVLKSLTVHSGILSIKIGEDSAITLNKGDTMSFSSDVYQVYQNHTEDVSEINMAIYYSSPHIQSGPDIK